MKYVNQAIRKVDAMSLVTGKPVYTGDMVPANTSLPIKMYPRAASPPRARPTRSPAPTTG